MPNNYEEIIEKLSPLERKIVPYLKLPIAEIAKRTKLDQTSLLRALKFLENKGVVKIVREKNRIIELGTNGVYYKKQHLPERTLLLMLENNKHISLEDAKKLSKLSDNEFKVSLGALKNKALIEIKNGKIFLIASNEELTKKMPEESFLESLPVQESLLSEEQRFSYNNLKKRKNIIEIKEKKFVNFELTELGKQLAGKEISIDLVEEVSPEIIRDWRRDKKFRKYDIKSEVAKIFGGRKHFVNDAIEKGRRIWLDMGFKEMSSSLIQTSFWNFDALFTAQDHPVRELHDTLFIKNLTGSLPDKKIVNKVKEAHESGVEKSKGWQYDWKEDEAKKVLLRTHTTCLSAKTLANIKKEDFPAKFFAIGKCFRNETVDWAHSFEFNQTEGIVVDKNANFRHLLGYLKIFFKKMGFEEIRFTPSYFPYTEPSLEIYAFYPEKGVWLELGGAGIFRPEVTIPLLGEAIPVLAWGPGFDRIIMNYYKIKDLREMYENDIEKLRKIKPWLK